MSDFAFRALYITGTVRETDLTCFGYRFKLDVSMLTSDWTLNVYCPCDANMLLVDCPCTMELVSPYDGEVAWQAWRPESDWTDWLTTGLGALGYDYLTAYFMAMNVRDGLKSVMAAVRERDTLKAESIWLSLEQELLHEAV